MRRAAVFLLAALILMGCGAVCASGGTSGETLVSQSYLNGTYLPAVAEQAGRRLEEKTQSTYDTVLSGLNAKHSAYLAQAGGETSLHLAFADHRLKKGDTVTVYTGSGLLLLAGSAAVAAPSGAVVDVTAGRALAAGAALTEGHRYLAGENASAAVTITSDTAVVGLEGAYTRSDSGALDYNALADALKAMGLFQGTGTAYGCGYDLEVAPTRVVGLVMFLRLIGEEGAALACTQGNPFADTPAWCDRYVAYAYAKGYTKGVGADAAGALYFAPDTVLSAGEYMTFVLRALGYTDSGTNPDFSWSNALGKSVELGVLNSAEQAMLTGGSFLRAQVVYVSYFALSAATKDGGGTLLDRLVSVGGVDEAALYTTMNSVTVSRLQSGSRS